MVPSVNTPLGNTAAGDSTTNKGDCSAAKGDKKYVKSAKNVDEKTSDSSAALVMSQLALSDRVLLNKSDLISPEEVWFSRFTPVPSLYDTCARFFVGFS